MFAESTAIYLADFGVVAAFGAASGTVLLDQADQDVVSGHAISREYTMTFRTADFPALKFGDTGTVNSIAYQVRAVHRIDDSVFAHATLTKS